jgi:hypothetical protein
VKSLRNFKPLDCEVNYTILDEFFTLFNSFLLTGQNKYLKFEQYIIIFARAVI